MRLGFGRRLRHPFFPGLKLTAAAEVGQEASALCGTLEELIRAHGRGVRIHRAAFPLRGASEPLLSGVERDALWTRFEVPIYCLVLDDSGRVIGYECEAQSGVHVAEGYQGVLAGHIESEACECGRPGVRLVDGSILENTGLLTEASLLAG